MVNNHLEKLLLEKDISELDSVSDVERESNVHLYPYISIITHHLVH